MTVAPTVEVSSRDVVLDAARRLIVDHGYAGWSMRELAIECGLAKATIYHHFVDKHDIYISVLEREVMIARDRIAFAAASPGNAIDRLRAVIRTLYDLQAERHVVILSAIREIAGADTQLRSLLKRYRNELLAPIGDLLECGVRENLFRPVDDEMALITILGMMHSFVTHRLLSEENDSADTVVDHTVQLLLSGIGRHATLD